MIFVCIFGIFGVVTTVELRQVIDGLTAEERLFALAYLQHLERADDPAYQEELDGRMRRMDAGHKVTLEQLERLHRAMVAEGL